MHLTLCSRSVCNLTVTRAFSDQVQRSTIYPLQEGIATSRSILITNQLENRTLRIVYCGLVLLIITIIINITIIHERPPEVKLGSVGSVYTSALLDH